MTPDNLRPPAGWYTDPNDASMERWWNGVSWSPETRVAPAAAEDPSPSGYGGLPTYPSQHGYDTPTPAADRPVVTGMRSAIRTVFERYSDFRGRAGRPEYWYWNLVLFLVFFVLAFGGGFMSGQSDGSDDTATVFAFVAVIFVIGIIVPSIAVTVRRLRDAGLHWGLIFVNFIPYVGWVALMVLCCLPSKDPRGAAASAGATAP